MDQFDHAADVVVVGSGAAGMITAWTAKRLGLDVILIEKAGVYGGNTALSGGGAWLPNAPFFKRRGEGDDPEALFRYLRTIAPDVDPERHRKYIAEAPRIAEALENAKPFKNGFLWIKGYSDYYPELGGSAAGRGIWPTAIDERVLGDEASRRLTRGGGRIPGAPKGMWMTSADYHDLISLRWGGIRGPKMLLKLAWRSAVAAVTGRRMVTSGAALVTRLRMLLRDEDVPIWLNTPMKSVVRDETGRAVGVEVEREGRTERIGARRGVMLAAGGFESNAEMRAKYQPMITPGLSSGSESNTGDGIVAGEEVGGKLDLMDDAWWMPGIQLPGGVWGMVSERAYPHQFIVNGDGKRFVNEAAPYTDFGHKQIAGHEKGVSHFPAYMVIDHFAWQHYFFGGLPNRTVPQEWLDAESMFKADTLEELAQQIGVPPQNLVETAERFNGFARAGEDEDFHRGESAYDRWYGNPKYDNPNLGEVKKPPFYAFKMVLGDLGTKGGLLTDENAHVLASDGSIIPGLYSAGNNSAAVMGNSYAGPGATIGPAMTFGWVAAHDMAEAGNGPPT